MAITPIETRYAGCRFRSRLEARWAVFFDHLGIEWEYEPQGYAVNGRGYLPDFRITVGKMKFTVEVKGENDRLDMQFLADFVKQSREDTYLLVLGPIPRDTPLTPTHVLLYQPVGYFAGPHDLDRIRDISDRLSGIPESDQFAVWDFINEQGQAPVSATLAAFFYGSAPFLGPLSFMPNLVTGAFDPLAPPVMPVISPKPHDAYTAARSARFEHGEEG